MLVIAQTGQAEKANLLSDMQRLRKRVFHDRMRWDVTITEDGREIDEFDLPGAVYLLALNDDQQVIGNWRLLPSNGPTMIGNIWPFFMESIDLPFGPFVWEASRFAVDSLTPDHKANLAQVSRATEELFCGLTELCLLCGINEIFTMYDMRIARLLKRLDCQAREVSERFRIDETLCEVGVFTTDIAMLSRLRAASGIRDQLVTADMLPPVLLPYYENRPRLQEEREYAAA